MSKKNSFIKYLKNISKIINNLLEKNLNKLNSKNLSFLLKNNKIILTFVALLVIFVTYLLLPTLYNQNDISKKLKNEILNKFDLNFEFSENHLELIYKCSRHVWKCFQSMQWGSCPTSYSGGNQVDGSPPVVIKEDEK